MRTYTDKVSAYLADALFCVTIIFRIGLNGGATMKMRFRKRKATSVVLLILCLFGTACGTSQESVLSVPEENKLIVYTSHKEEVYAPIIKEFQERTGIWVELHTGGTSELLEEIAEEKGGFTCDIMFGGGIESYSAYSDYLEPYVCSRNESIKEQYRSEDGSYTAFTELPIVFIYNNKLVESSQAPTGWQELFYESWQGNIAFGDPLKSGSSYTMLATLIQIMGMEPEVTLKQFAKTLDYNVSAGSGEAVDEVASGVRAIGLTLEETALKAIDNGADISVVYPKDGTSTVPDGCAMVAGAKHTENAKRFIEFIVEDDVQQLAVDRLHRRSVLESIQQPGDKGMKVLDFDVEWAGAHREEILKIWADIMTERGR